jgi:cytochrome P450
MQQPEETGVQQATVAPPKMHERVPAVSNLLALARDPLAFIKALHDRHGDVVEFNLAGDRWVLLAHPTDIERVHVESTRTYRKGYQTYKKTGYVFNRILGNGLVTSEGSFWRTQRRLAQPAFHASRIRGYATTMVRYTSDLVDQWRPGQEVDLRVAMGALTQRIAGKALFGADTATDAARVNRALDTLMRGFDVELNSLFVERLPVFVPTRNRRRVNAAITDFDQIVTQFVADRQGSAAGHDDLLAMLCEARDDDGSQMTEGQLRDELVTMYAAAQETTASALSWMWHSLGGHPDVAARVRDEVRRVLGGRSATPEDIGELKVLRAAVDEVLRLYPPLWRVFRVPDTDVEFQQYRVPAGSYVWMSQWITQRDPRWFDRPDAFDPDRWLDGRTEGLPRYAFWPFGGGPRICIGNGFAIMTIMLVAATVLQRTQYTLVDHPVRPLPGITLRPDPGVRVRIDAVAEQAGQPAGAVTTLGAGSGRAVAG